MWYLVAKLIGWVFKQHLNNKIMYSLALDTRLLPTNKCSLQPWRYFEAYKQHNYQQNQKRFGCHHACRCYPHHQESHQCSYPTGQNDFNWVFHGIYMCECLALFQNTFDLNYFSRKSTLFNHTRNRPRLICL